MKYIFLDVDGVLNNILDAEKRYKKTGEASIGYDWPFCEESLETLQKIVRKTNSKIVVSSSWRFREKGRNTLLEELEKYDLKKDVIDFLDNEYKSKSILIAKYLKKLEKENKNKKIDFIVLDDENLKIKDAYKHFYQVNMKVGLRKEDFSKVVELFKKQEKNEL